jgi:hypothetical protein
VKVPWSICTSHFAPEIGDDKVDRTSEITQVALQEQKSETRSKLHNMAPRIAIIYYSTYGHVEKLAVAQQRGIEKAGGNATIFQQVSIIKPDCDF